MRLSTLLGGSFSALAFAQTQDAPVVSNNPHVKYEATLPQNAFFQGNLNGNVRGSVRAGSGPGGVGVEYQVQFTNFPTEGGPFIYHIHVLPVPADGNCTNTLAHLDPYGRGEDPACDSTNPQSCQVGDLSGKYGSITQGPFSATYTDPYSSLQEGTPAFMGNRSIVVHFANKTRITCANFVKVPCDADENGGNM